MSEPTIKSKGCMLIGLQPLKAHGEAYFKKLQPNSYLVALEDDVLASMSARAKADATNLIHRVLEVVCSEEEG